MSNTSKFTAKTRDRILAAIRAGGHREVAAAFAGVSKVTLYDWLRRGARGEPGYAEFHADLEQAIATGEMRWVAWLNKAAESGEWRATLALLERVYPERWAPRQKIETTTRPSLDLSKLSTEEVRQWRDILRKARREGNDE